MNQKELARRLLEARQAKQWTQRNLSKAAKVTETTISHLEAGAIANPNPRTLRRLARALDLSYEELSLQAGIIPPAYHRLVARHPDTVAAHLRTLAGKLT